MLYRIAPGKAGDKIVTVEEDGNILLTLPADNLKAAHKIVKNAQADGWESLIPAKKGK